MDFNIKELSTEEKVELMKALVDEMDIVITASYGATDIMCSENIMIANYDQRDNLLYGEIKKGETVIVATDIMTG